MTNFQQTKCLFAFTFWIVSINVVAKEMLVCRWWALFYRYKSKYTFYILIYIFVSKPFYAGDFYMYTFYVLIYQSFYECARYFCLSFASLYFTRTMLYIYIKKMLCSKKYCVYIWKMLFTFIEQTLLWNKHETNIKWKLYKNSYKWG